MIFVDFKQNVMTFLCLTFYFDKPNSFRVTDRPTKVLNKVHLMALLNLWRTPDLELK